MPELLEHQDVTAPGAARPPRSRDDRAARARRPAPPDRPARARARRALRLGASRARGSIGASAPPAARGCSARASSSGFATRSRVRLRDARAELAERGRRRGGEPRPARADDRRARDAIAGCIVSNEDIGERGCRHWHSRPRWGILGMLLGWWRVRLSSGCPLAGGLGPRLREPSLIRIRPDGKEATQARARARPPQRRRTRRAAPRRLAAPKPPRRRQIEDERPPAPWGSFPLVELVVLVALVMLVVGFFVDGARGTDAARHRPRARLAGRPRALDPRALRRLPLAHAPARRVPPASRPSRSSSTPADAISLAVSAGIAVAVACAVVAIALARVFRARSGALDQAPLGCAGTARLNRWTARDPARSVQRAHRRPLSAAVAVMLASAACSSGSALPLGWLWIGSQVQSVGLAGRRR